MAFLMSAVDVTAPGGVWEWFILHVFGFISNYGWRVVLLVVVLKLILSPLDFYQKYKMRKNQRITEALKPQLEKLQKKCGDDKQEFQRRQMELTKKSGYSYFSACIPLIITLVLFITFFTALRSVSSYMEFNQYVQMYDSYVTAYDNTGFDYEKRINGGTDFLISTVKTTKDEEGNSVTSDKNINYEDMDKWLNEIFASDEALTAIVDREEISALFKEATINEPVAMLKKYKTEYIDAGRTYKDYVEENKGKGFADYETDEERFFHLAMSVLMQAKAQYATLDAFEANRTSFLWIKSLWVADVPWANSIPGADAFFNSMRNTYLSEEKNTGHVYERDDQKAMFNDLADKNTYNLVTARVSENDKLYKTNGYMILVVLVLALSLLSQFITSRQQKKAGQLAEGSGSGMMKIMMWVMPILFAVFAISYSGAFSLYMVVNSAMSLIINLLTTLIVDLIEGKPKKETVIKHGRQDPNDRINKK